MKVIDMFASVSSGNDSVPVEHRYLPPPSLTRSSKNLALAPSHSHLCRSLSLSLSLTAAGTAVMIRHSSPSPSAGFGEFVNALVNADGFDIFIDTVSRIAAR